MSGIGIALAAAAGPTAPPPLNARVTWNGKTPLTVSGASGVAHAISDPWSPNVLVYILSGGAPPYSESGGLLNNPSGKLSIAAAPDGTHNTIAWSNFAINEVQSTDVNYIVTDSAGTTVTSTYTGIIVQRTS